MITHKNSWIREAIRASEKILEVSHFCLLAGGYIIKLKRKNGSRRHALQVRRLRPRLFLGTKNEPQRQTLFGKIRFLFLTRPWIRNRAHGNKLISSTCVSIETTSSPICSVEPRASRSAKAFCQASATFAKTKSAVVLVNATHAVRTRSTAPRRNGRSLPLLLDDLDNSDAVRRNG